MKNTMLFSLAIFVFLLGDTLALILMYASPDNIAHVFHGSISFLGSSIFIFSLYLNLDNSMNKVFKLLFTLLGVYIVLCSIILCLISIYANPDLSDPYSIDIKAAILFFISALLVGVGIVSIFKKKSIKAINE
jgi:hypothetical protein